MPPNDPAGPWAHAITSPAQDQALRSRPDKAAAETVSSRSAPINMMAEYDRLRRSHVQPGALGHALLFLNITYNLPRTHSTPETRPQNPCLFRFRRQPIAPDRPKVLAPNQGCQRPKKVIHKIHAREPARRPL